MEKKAIKPDTVLNVVQEVSEEEGIELPSEIEQDFSALFGENEDITSYRQIENRWCRVLRESYEADSALENKYELITFKIVDKVRLKICLLLGFDEYIRRPSVRGLSLQEVLKEFLKNLNPEEEWNVEKLKKWRYQGHNMGAMAVARIQVRSRLTSESLAIILGEETENLLERNPFTRNQRITSMSVAGGYLLEFLFSEVGCEEEWNASALRSWVSKDGIRGDTIYKYINESEEGGWSIDTIRKVLKGKPGIDSYLNNFKKTVDIIVSPEIAQKYLIEFLDAIADDNEWKPQDLINWEASDGVRGKNLYDWIRRNHKAFNQSAVRKVLGDRKDLLERKKLVKEIVKIEDEESVKKYLLEFLSTLDEGTTWSPARLREWSTATDTGHEVKGGRIYEWVWRNKGEFSDETISQLLGEDKKNLEKKPFKKEEKVLLKVATVRRYLKEFISSLGEGKRWSAQDIIDWQSDSNDSVAGFSIYCWIKINQGDFSKETMEQVLGEEAEVLLEKNPFESSRKLTSVEKIKIYLREFLEQLEEGEPWYPGKLREWVAEDGCRGVSLYRYMLKKIRDDDQDKPDWVFILIKLIPERFLFRNPFYLRYKEFLGGKDDFTTSKPESYIENSPDTGTKTPLQIMLDAEEEESYQSEVDEEMQDVHAAIDKLSLKHRKTVLAFYNDEEVDEVLLNEALANLRDLID